MKRNKQIWILLSLMSLLLVACNNDIIYDKQKEISNTEWNFDDVKKFNINIEDTLEYVDFYIIIRNTIDYKYANLFLFLTTMTPNNDVSHDTLQFLLADMEGKWLGDGTGNFRENVFLFQHGIQFSQKGTYSFEFTQAMRDTNLIGVSDIGIRIEKAQE